MILDEARLVSLFASRNEHFRILMGLSLGLYRNLAPFSPVCRPVHNSELVRLLEKGDALKSQIKHAAVSAESGESITLFYPFNLACTAVPVRTNGGRPFGYHIRMEGFFLGRHPARFNPGDVKVLSENGVHLESEKIRALCGSTVCLDWRKLENLVHEMNLLAESLVKDLQRDVASHPGIRRGIDFIQANLDQELTLQSVAQHAGMSHYHFSRVFRQETGESFTRYVSRLRCNKALDMITSGGQRISEVAFDCGFQSLSQFNRSFVVFFGKNPAAFYEKAQRGISKIR